MGAGARQPVRVLQVVRPAAGGMRAHVLQLARGLAPFGFQSEIACPGDSDLVHDALEAKIAVHPVPIVGPLHPLRDPMAIIGLAEIMRSRRPRIVHAHGSKAGLLARIAARFAGNPPVVVTVHNQVLYGGVSPLMRRIYLFAERWLARRTARIITVSEALRREQLDVFGMPEDLVTCIPNGLDLAPFVAARGRAAARERYGIPADAVVLGLAARFAPQKAHGDLLAAALPLLEENDRLWLLLGGDGPLVEPARTQARASRARDRVLFPGYETDVPTFLAALDVYVNASVAEGLGLGTVEAMAAGLPVVATAVGGTPEVVEDGVTGLLVPAGKPTRMAEALRRMVRDPASRRAMGEAGRARALDLFAEPRMLERVAAVYDEVVR